MSEIERLHQQRLEREKAKPKSEPDPTEWRPKDNSDWERVDANVASEQMRSQPLRFQSLVGMGPLKIEAIEANSRADLIRMMEQHGLYPDERGIRVHWALVVEGNGFRMPEGFVHPEAPTDVRQRGREAWKRCVEMASDSLDKFIFAQVWRRKVKRVEQPQVRALPGPEVLHDPDCPMTNRDPGDRTTCTCDGSQWYAEDGSHRTVPEGEGL